MGSKTKIIPLDTNDLIISISLLIFFTIVVCLSKTKNEIKIGFLKYVAFNMRMGKWEGDRVYS